MIIDPVCALVFEAERDESRIMQRPPRKPDEKLFTLPLVGRSVGEGGLAFALLAMIVLVGTRMQLTGLELRTLVFFALVAAILAMVLAHRAYSASLGHALFRHNIVFRYVFAVIAGMSGVILGIPSMGRRLGFATLGWSEIAMAGGTGAVLLLVFELAKIVARRLETAPRPPASSSRNPAPLADSDH